MFSENRNILIQEAQKDKLLIFLEMKFAHKNLGFGFYEQNMLSKTLSTTFFSQQ